MPPETARALLRAARDRLRAAAIPTPELDARLLLQRAAGLSHEMLVAEPDRIIPEEAAGAFEGLVRRRLAREPVSRIAGEREFYGRCFRIGRAALDPRPESEILIEAALRQPWRRPRLLDLGTGSGALIVTLLAEIPDSTGLATDISAEALAIAAENAERHGVGSRLALQRADWLGGLAGRFDLIVANPPYIPSAEISGLPLEVSRFDPISALDGGGDGLEAYRRIAAQAADHLDSSGLLLVEIGAGQAAAVTAIYSQRGFIGEVRWPDLAGHIRCLAFRRGSGNAAK